MRRKMKQIKIRGLVIGEGMPKICVPVIGKTKEEICVDAKKIMEQEVLPDLVEWRADWFQNLQKEEQMFDTARSLRGILGEIPMLFTVRTKKEGGELELSYEAYEEILLRAARSGLADAVDVEAFFWEEKTNALIQKVKQYGVVAVASNHDFLKTPSKQDMIQRLTSMGEYADIAKLAVMPQSRQDVLALLEVTKEVSQKSNMCPLITMSMSKLGEVSRICGELSNSTITFACVEKASAPGQIEIGELKRSMEFVHSCMKH